MRVYRWGRGGGQADSRRLTSFHLALGRLSSECMTSPNLSTMSHCPDIILPLTLFSEKEKRRESET
jgi:hypothetical protein